ncbi:MAG: A/G-specific adenine glycosylase [Alphaproteobacteria bacterium]|nr:A/G-specific adenine glycosylase [Alphaproteobacteria bacterium]
MPPSKTATKTPPKAKKAKSVSMNKLATAAAGLKSEDAKPKRAKKTAQNPAQKPVKKPITALPATLQKPNHAEIMLAWFDREGRHLPWRHRAEPGGAGVAHPDPYHVFLSEIMLQQTTVATVIPYFNNFIKNYPTIKDLAAAPLDKVLTDWAGLGYYARARNMHKTARQLVELYRGEWPQSEEKLRSLPGIGPYTAAAIAAIGFDQKAVVVDGNIERVVSRLFAVDDVAPDPSPKAASAAKLKKKIYDLAEILTPDHRPGDYAQAMMDLGASYCSPRQPLCGLCPIFRHCDGYLSGHPENYPRKKAKAVKPVRYGVAYWLKRGDGTVLLRRRVEKGLLGGMMEFPCTNFSEDEKIGFDLGAARIAAPLTTAKWRKLEGRVTHIFTHFRLEIIVLAAEVRLADGNLGQWVKPDSFDTIALPTLFRKIASHALKQGG